MDDSDDYFNDSFVLDDNVLEALQEAETKHIGDATQGTAQTSSSKTRTVSPPPVKRQKIVYNVESSSDDETPDVLVQRDGSYNVMSRRASSSAPKDGAAVAAPRRPTGQSNQSIPNGIHRENSVRRVVERATSRTPPVNRTSGNARTTANNTPTNRVQSPAAVASSSRVSVEESQLQDEIAKLRAQVEQLNHAKAESESALKKATDAQYAKEGEVKILRQLAVKTAEEHAAELAKLQASKAAAEERQAKMEKDQKAELERMRTQITFNQLDGQALARKPPGSARSRTPRNLRTQSPMPLPSNMKAWNATASGSQGLTSTPLRPRANAERSRSPQKRTGPSVQPRLNFPGFENSFMQSTPVKSPTSSRTRRPSGLGVDGNLESTPRRQSQAGPSRQRDDVFSPSKRSPSKRDAAVGRLPPKEDFIQDFDMDIPHSTPPRPRRASSPAMDFGDMSSVIGSDVNDMAVDSDKGDLDEDNYEGLDFREEFHRVLSSHISPPSRIVTFQVLLSTHISEDADADLRYQSYCSDILNALGDKFNFGSLEDLMGVVASAIVDMVEMLLDGKILSSLQGIMDLLRSIVAYMPGFSSSLLSAHQRDGDATPKFIALVCKLFKASFEVPKSDSGTSWESLRRMTLHLLAAMVWVSPEDQVSKMSTLARTDHLFTSLLDDRRDPETLSRTTHLLVVSATHPPLTNHFISLPDIDVRPVDDRPRDVKRIPLLERLNALVADCSVSTKNEIVQSILDFYTLLIINNSDGRSVLLKSITIVPSIVRFLHELTTLLYDEDERVTSSPVAASTAVHMVSHALRLLHLLVFTSPPSSSPTQSQAARPYNLRYALYHAPHLHFNGVAHMFMVMVGRLGCANAPEWLEQPLQNQIERLTDPARDLMDLVVQGPEVDAVWAAYQDDDGVDDEEEEARALDV